MRIVDTNQDLIDLINDQMDLIDLINDQMPEAMAAPSENFNGSEGGIWFMEVKTFMMTNIYTMPIHSVLQWAFTLS